MKAKSIVLAVVFITSSLLAGCVAPESQQRQTTTVKGSDTMVLLGQRWAEIYMKQHPDVSIQVTGGGSGTGIAALINGTTDICQASRPMTEMEKNSAKQQRNADVLETPVALDALAVYLNKQNSLDHLNMDQISRIFKGEITNWKDVGGSDGTIVLYGRENSSGTYVFFKEHVLANADFATNYQGLPGTAAVINAVTKDIKGIGYGGIGYSTDLKAISISQQADSSPVAPSMENVFNKTYPLSRQLFWYTAGSTEGAMKDFVNWVLSPDGQKVVIEVGYYPLHPPAQTQ